MTTREKLDAINNEKMVKSELFVFQSFERGEKKNVELGFGYR
jgi:hypothetical protein